MKSYETTVTGMIEFLKVKEVCRSSINSHRDCYDQFSTFLQAQALDWDSDTVEQWLVGLKDSVHASRYVRKCEIPAYDSRKVG